jgi:hypothetical protein
MVCVGYDMALFSAYHPLPFHGASTITAGFLLQYFTYLYAQPIGQVQKLDLYTVIGNENNESYINMCAPGRILPRCAGDQADKRY